MKKLLALLLAVISVFTFASCQNTSKTDKSYVIGVVDGAPSLAVGNIANGYSFAGKDFTYQTTVEIAAQPTDIIAGLTNGDLDMAIIPLNLASKVYNESKNLNLKLATVNIFGCLYMIGNEDINSVEDLKGKVVYTVGSNGTPEIIFNYLLSQNGITYEYGDEASDNQKVFVKVADAQQIMAGFMQGTIEYAILGEPVVSKINAKTGTKVVMDLQEEWKKYNPNGKFVQAGLAVKGEVAENTEYLNGLIEKLSENNDYLIENVESLKALYTDVGSAALQMDFTADIITRCNVGCERASDERENIEAFLTAVKNFKAPLVGGKLPESDFYL